MDKKIQPKGNKNPRTSAPELNPEERKKNFKEVRLGYSPAMAQHPVASNAKNRNA